MTPVLAVANGTVVRVQQEVGTGDCCWAAIRHHDGWQSYYIHLNNDIYGTDDGQGIGVRPDLVVGSEVAAGEVIGWLGDSGNAEETVVHLHFELRTPQGVAVDAWPSLARVQPARGIPELEPNWPYRDDDGAPTETLVATLLSQGLVLPSCGDDLTRFCPEGIATVEFLRAASTVLADADPHLVEGQPPPSPEDLGEKFTDPRHQAEALGCDPRECLDSGMTLSKLAALADARIDSVVDADPGLATTGQMLTVMSADQPSGNADAHLVALTACLPTIEADSFVGRSSALGLMIQWITEVDPGQCRYPTLVQEAPVKIVSRSELTVEAVSVIHGGMLFQVPTESVTGAVATTENEVESTDEVFVVTGPAGPETGILDGGPQTPPLDDVPPVVPPDGVPGAPAQVPPVPQEVLDLNPRGIPWATPSARVPGGIQSRVRRSSARLTR